MKIKRKLLCYNNYGGGCKAVASILTSDSYVHNSTLYDKQYLPENWVIINSQNFPNKHVELFRNDSDYVLTNNHTFSIFFTYCPSCAEKQSTLEVYA